jgi:hypothetical protein
VSSPLFLYYNLRSRLSLVRRHGPPGAPSVWSVARLWLRLWRPAVQSGLARSGWRALRRAFQDYRRGATGPAPEDLRGRRPSVAAVLALLGALSLTLPAGVGVSSVRAEERGQPVRSERVFLASVWPAERGPVPPDLVHLLFRMAQDEDVARDVLERAGPAGRPLTHRILALVSLSPTQGGERIEGLHVIRDDSPPPGERPPTWHDLRRAGLRLLVPIALDEGDARDLRLRRAMEDDALSRSGDHARASVVGARLELWQQWWADRGLAEEYWLDPSLRPDPTPWLDALRTPLDQGGRTVLQLLLPLADDPLARHALVESLEPAGDGFLVAECMEVVHLYPRSFEEHGIPPRRWSSEEGRMVGHTAGTLRQVALEILDVVCSHIPSGADEDEVLDDWALWWRGARFQARYWRDPHGAPSLAPWLADLVRPVEEGGPTMPDLLRRWYVALGFRDLLLDQLGPEEAPLVSELVAWLGMDERTAVARGFVRAFRRPLPRPLPGDAGPMVAIPWPSVQAMIREMLRRITGDAGLPEEGVEETVRNAFWRDWWSAHRDEARWYRDGGPAPGAPRFPMERGTAG